MAISARQFFGVEPLSDYVLSSMSKTNLDIVGYESIFISFCSLVLFGATFLPIPPWSDMSVDSVLIHRIGFASVMVACVLSHVAVLRVKRMDRRSFVAPLVMLLFIVAVMGISMWMTLADFSSTGTMLVYVSALVLLFGVIYLPPIIIFLVVLVCTLVMASGLAVQGYTEFVVYASLGVYAFLAIAVALTGYHARLRSTRANEAIHNASIRDELTGVKNRRALDADAARFVNADVRILLGDIDEFKFYNDSFGHAAGDEMLKRFAESMTRAFDGEYVYRYGGDEFVAVMRDVSESEFLDAIDAWRVGFAGIEVDGEVYSPTTSGGFVSGTPLNVDEFQEMLRLADLRLYDSKQAGRNTVLGSAYDERSKEELSSGMQLLRERRSGDSDPLTGLPSITYFYTHAKTVIDSPKLDDAHFSIVYFNIANMKVYNERFGMMAGDELLVFVAHVIEDSFEHALVARFGDDRFVMLTYGDDLFEGLESVYDRVFSYSSDARTVIQAGVFPYERDIEISEACDRAKLACDHLKGDYSAHYCLYDDELMAAHNLKAFIVDHFDEAIEKGHIQVYYQPILRTIGKRMSDVEALARWVDPERGLILPADFVPILEEYRLIHKLDLRIIELFCMDYQEFAKTARTAVPMSVNLSRYDLELCDIVEEVVAILDRYGVPSHMLNIEVAESAFSRQSDLLRAMIERFHQHGVHVWMDGFGSGRSSITVLREYMLDAIKIDMAFFEHEDDVSRTRARTMLPHFIGMAKELGILTVAERVETPDQYEFLRDIGCEKVQGFEFARPMPLDQLSQLMEPDCMPPERRSQRLYYDAVGSVDLLMLSSLDEGMSHTMELSSGLPAAIVQFCGDEVSYLAWNSSYLDYLRDIGMNTIENSTRQMNDLSRPQSQGFLAAAKKMWGKPEWLNLTFYEGDDLCTGMARCLAVDDAAGACAFVYIAFNISSFLSNAGYELSV